MKKISISVAILLYGVSSVHAAKLNPKQLSKTNDNIQQGKPKQLGNVRNKLKINQDDYQEYIEWQQRQSYDNGPQIDETNYDTTTYSGYSDLKSQEFEEDESERRTYLYNDDSPDSDSAYYQQKQSGDSFYVEPQAEPEYFVYTSSEPEHEEETQYWNDVRNEYTNLKTYENDHPPQQYQEEALEYVEPEIVYYTSQEPSFEEDYYTYETAVQEPVTFAFSDETYEYQPSEVLYEEYVSEPVVYQTLDYQLQEETSQKPDDCREGVEVCKELNKVLIGQVAKLGNDVGKSDEEIIDDIEVAVEKFQDVIESEDCLSPSAKEEVIEATNEQLQQAEVAFGGEPEPQLFENQPEIVVVTEETQDVVSDLMQEALTDLVFNSGDQTDIIADIQSQLDEADVPEEQQQEIIEQLIESKEEFQERVEDGESALAVLQDTLEDAEEAVTEEIIVPGEILFNEPAPDQEYFPEPEVQVDTEETQEIVTDLIQDALTDLVVNSEDLSWSEQRDHQEEVIEQIQEQLSDADVPLEQQQEIINELLDSQEEFEQKVEDGQSPLSALQDSIEDAEEAITEEIIVPDEIIFVNEPEHCHDEAPLTTQEQEVVEEKTEEAINDIIKLELTGQSEEDKQEVIDNVVQDLIDEGISADVIEQIVSTVVDSQEEFQDLVEEEGLTLQEAAQQTIEEAQDTITDEIFAPEEPSYQAEEPLSAQELETVEEKTEEALNDLISLEVFGTEEEKQEVITETVQDLRQEGFSEGEIHDIIDTIQEGRDDFVELVEEQGVSFQDAAQEVIENTQETLVDDILAPVEEEPSYFQTEPEVPALTEEEQEVVADKTEEVLNELITLSVFGSEEDQEQVITDTIQELREEGLDKAQIDEIIDTIQEGKDDFVELVEEQGVSFQDAAQEVIADTQDTLTDDIFVPIEEEPTYYQPEEEIPTLTTEEQEVVQEKTEEAINEIINLEITGQSEEQKNEAIEDVVQELREEGISEDVINQVVDAVVESNEEFIDKVNEEGLSLVEAAQETIQETLETVTEEVTGEPTFVFEPLPQEEKIDEVQDQVQDALQELFTVQAEGGSAQEIADAQNEIQQEVIDTLIEQGASNQEIRETIETINQANEDFQQVIEEGGDISEAANDILDQATEQVEDIIEPEVFYPTEDDGYFFVPPAEEPVQEVVATQTTDDGTVCIPVSKQALQDLTVTIIEDKVREGGSQEQIVDAVDQLQNILGYLVDQNEPEDLPQDIFSFNGEEVTTPELPSPADTIFEAIDDIVVAFQEGADGEDIYQGLEDAKQEQKTTEVIDNIISEIELPQMPIISEDVRLDSDIVVVNQIEEIITQLEEKKEFRHETEEELDLIAQDIIQEILDEYGQNPGVTEEDKEAIADQIQQDLVIIDIAKEIGIPDEIVEQEIAQSQADFEPPEAEPEDYIVPIDDIYSYVPEPETPSEQFEPSVEDTPYEGGFLQFDEPESDDSEENSYNGYVPEDDQIYENKVIEGDSGIQWDPVEQEVVYTPVEDEDHSSEEDSVEENPFADIFGGDFIQEEDSDEKQEESEFPFIQDEDSTTFSSHDGEVLVSIPDGHDELNVFVNDELQDHQEHDVSTDETGISEQHYTYKVDRCVETGQGPIELQINVFQNNADNVVLQECKEKCDNLDEDDGKVQYRIKSD